MRMTGWTFLKGLFLVGLVSTSLASGTQEESDGAPTYHLRTGERAAAPLQQQHDMILSDLEAILKECGLKEGMRVWDLGCGTGTLTRLLAEKVGPSGHVWALDFSKAQLDVARATLQEDGYTNVTFVQHDLTQPFAIKEDQKGDFLVSRFVLMHLEAPKEAVGLMRDYVKQGGACLLMEPDNSRNSLARPCEQAQSFRKTLLEVGEKAGLDYSLGARLACLCEGVWQVKSVREKCYQNNATGTQKLWRARLEEMEEKLLASGMATQGQIDGWRHMIDNLSSKEEGWYSSALLYYVHGVKE
ncbi:MAG: hypothetical protein C0514_07870 [Candidatus Puniceispirillum sp.]|nr:hypothetical protein [Candidatus Puniceispirillum sp.]